LVEAIEWEKELSWSNGYEDGYEDALNPLENDKI
jgi:hypothetical protein